MKLLVIRMSALATVVALGLIAIAQAQRGVEDPPPKVEASKAPGSAPAEQGVGKKRIAGAEVDTKPGLFPGAETANPLRAPDRQPLRGHVIATSSDSGEADPSPSHATGSAGSPEQGTLRRRDPLPVIAAVGTESANEPPQAALEPPLNTTHPDARVDAGAVAPNRYPQLVSPGESDSAAGSQPSATPTEPSSVGSLVGERYADRILSDGESREPPARLDLDPRVPVSSLPSPSASTDSYSLPGPGPDSGDFGRSAEGTGTPGSRQLEGPQTPQLTIHKTAPEEIQVGSEATFRVTVANTGQIAAHGVEIHDEIPRGTRLVGTTPQFSRYAQGKLVWSVGTMEPGDEVSVEVQLMPEQEGEIGSVATVSFQADASARTIATKPELTVQTSAPSQVLIGQEMTLLITVSNPGSGTAYGVVLEEHVPPGLRHPEGDELEHPVGDLKPNESRQMELTLLAEAPGVFTNLLSARAEANLRVEDRLEIEVLAPQLDLALAGPKRRYLEREATYELSVSNTGTAPAERVEMIAQLPSGLEFVTANNSGQYEAASRTVHWVLEELPVQETGTVRLTAIPVEAGEHTLRFTCTGEPGLVVEAEHPVLIEGIAAILFQVVDVEDPIELGGETTYEIRVLNQGSKAATKVKLWATVPPGMRAIAAEGPVRHAIDGNLVSFDALPRLAPKADTTYRVRVQGRQPGDLRLSVHLQTGEMETPVTKEESTRVYSDE